MSRRAATDRPRSCKVVIDLAAHRRGFAEHRVGKVRATPRRGIGDDGERGLQRVGEIAGVTPRLLSLSFAVCKQLVDLFRKRPDFSGEIVAYARLLARADVRDLVANSPQWPKTIEGLQRGERKEAKSERGEAPDERHSKAPDLVVDRLARLRDLKSPAHRRSGKDRISLGNPQRLGIVAGRKFVAIVKIGLQIDMRSIHSKSTVPQRPRSEGNGTARSGLATQINHPRCAR